MSENHIIVRNYQSRSGETAHTFFWLKMFLYITAFLKVPKKTSCATFSSSSISHSNFRMPLDKIGMKITKSTTKTRKQAKKTVRVRTKRNNKHRSKSLFKSSFRNAHAMKSVSRFFAKNWMLISFKLKQYYSRLQVFPTKRVKYYNIKIALTLKTSQNKTIKKKKRSYQIFFHYSKTTPTKTKWK